MLHNNIIMETVYNIYPKLYDFILSEFLSHRHFYFLYIIFNLFDDYVCLELVPEQQFETES